MLTTLTLTAALLFPTLSKDLVAPVPGVSSRVSATRLAQMAARVDRLEAKAQLELYLGRHRPGDYIAGRVQLDSRALRLRKLRRDPALADFARIEARWLAEASGGTELFGSARELVQAKVMVTRNLHFRELEPTAANVAREVERILDQRGRFASLSLFEGRDVVYAASADRTRDAKKRKIFGRTVTQRQIERSGGRLHFLQAAGGREKPSLRRDLGREVASATQPLTFVFEGHGRPEAVKFAGSLRATEIAELIAQRSTLEPAVVITSACDAHTFIRAVLDHLERRAPEAPRPVFVVPVEYGQQLVRPVYSDPFLSRELGLATRDTHLGGLLDRAEIATSVYVPDENNVVTQVL